MKIRSITSADDAAIKTIVQTALKDAGLAIPGTAYYDRNLDHLAAFYAARSDRGYWVMTTDSGEVVGGAGCGEVNGANRVAELQKLYLRRDVRGHGLSYPLIDQVTRFARQAGYQQLYLESSHQLAAAIHIYEKLGFQRLAHPLIHTEHTAMDRFYLKSL